jgi:predicted lysophospholipase L1 biosynthesis ABC-type transport system permease subunit
MLGFVIGGAVGCLLGVALMVALDKWLASPWPTLA